MRKAIFFAIVILMGMSAWAVPARRDPFPKVQPNGDTITVRLVGDERWHAYYTEDGYLIQQGEDGWWYYAQWQKADDKAAVGDDEAVVSARQARKVAVATKRKAQNESARCRLRKRWLKKHIPNCFVIES